MSYVIEEGEYEEVELPDEVEDISEEMMDKSGELRGQAMSALSDGKFPTHLSGISMVPYTP